MPFFTAFKQSCKQRFLSIKTRVAILFFVACLAVASYAARNLVPKLNVEFGTSGLQKLTYKGYILEDLASFSADEFHIWHMKTTDLRGRKRSGDGYEWGEMNSGRTWDPVAHSWTYQFPWGFIRVQFLVHRTALDIQVTTSNKKDSGVIFCGASIYPFALHFPRLPQGFNANYSSLQFNTLAPSVTAADFGDGKAVAVMSDPDKPLYTGFARTSTANTYWPLISATTPDDLASFLPHNDRPVRPGERDTFTVSLRFAPAETSLSDIAGDAYQRWAKKWPPQFAWPDRRTIGAAFLASSDPGDPSRPHGYLDNPRRYFNDPKINVNTPDGLQSFQERVLHQARQNVANLNRLGAQGLITWDLEGQEYPQPTSYVGAPDAVSRLAPEMESVLPTDTAVYGGMKLIDAYFKIVRDAGFRVGVCVRPQQLVIDRGGKAMQVFPPSSQIAAGLVRKIAFARDRWKASLFYLDSNVAADGSTFEPAVIREVSRRFPDCLIIPEHGTAIDYASTAPFLSFLSHTDLGTPGEVYNFYPNAFSVNMINDVDADKLKKFRDQLKHSVQRGDILLVHADYWQQNNGVVSEIVSSARRSWFGIGNLLFGY